MTVETDDLSTFKRKLILRDSLALLTLLLVTAVLFLITLFLFRSFTAHREELARRWSARGQAALSSGHPEEATVALRTALSYAPGERSYELLLAQALGDAGHIEESYNYFLSLWETQPGDGLINLNLARLAARKKDPQSAINYYRAAIYGTWEGDGTIRRREVRLELARYLIAHGQPAEARNLILVVGGNSPFDPALDLTLARMLEDTGGTSDALSYYQKILAQEPRNKDALEAAARLQYQAGNFEEAHHLLERATREREPNSSGESALPPDLETMFENSGRLLALAPSRKLSNGERVSRILKVRDIAKSRFNQCNARLANSTTPPSALQNLSAAWSSSDAALSRSALLKDPSAQDTTVKLVFDTEIQTAQLCGPSTGDDALLLLLAQYPKTLEP